MPQGLPAHRPTAYGPAWREASTTAIGLPTPWLAGLAAAGLAADMFGATIINVTVLHWYGMAVMTVLLCAVFVLLAYGRRQQIKGLWAAIRR